MDEKDIEILIGVALPRGSVICWYPLDGANLPDPKIWAICDGANGTPDLRSMFVRGVSDVADVGLDQNASNSHSHSARARGNDQGPGKNGPNWGQVYSTTQGNDDLLTTWANHEHPVSVGEASNVPRNFKLIYLIKIK